MMQASEKFRVHELLSRAAYALDEHDLDMLGDCFAEDAVMRLRIAGSDPIPPYEGHVAIMTLMRTATAAQTDQRRHVVSNVFFEIEEETRARTVSNLTLFSVENGAIRLVCTGVYRDELRLEAGTWRIADRDLYLDLPY